MLRVRCARVYSLSLALHTDVWNLALHTDVQVRKKKKNIQMCTYERITNKRRHGCASECRILADLVRLAPDTAFMSLCGYFLADLVRIARHTALMSLWILSLLQHTCAVDTRVRRGREGWRERERERGEYMDSCASMFVHKVYTHTHTHKHTHTHTHTHTCAQSEAKVKHFETKENFAF